MKTTQQDMNRNPNGNGGFGDHPENRNPGGWKPENTISYQYKYFFNMDVEKCKDWLKNNPKRTVVQEIAWHAVARAREQFRYLGEVTDRTEGKPMQPIDQNITGELIINRIKYDDSDTS